MFALIMAFLLSRNSFHLVVTISIDFFSKSQRDVPWHCLVYYYSRTDWDGPGDHLRDDPWEDILKLSASGANGDFYEWT